MAFIGSVNDGAVVWHVFEATLWPTTPPRRHRPPVGCRTGGGVGGDQGLWLRACGL